MIKMRFKNCQDKHQSIFYGHYITSNSIPSSTDRATGNDEYGKLI